MSLQKSLIDGNLDHLFTRVNLLIAGGALLLASVAAAGLYDRIAGPGTPEIACFGAGEPIARAQTKTAEKADIDLFGPWQDRAKFSEPFSAPLLSAAAACPAASCDGDAGLAYQRALKAYLGRRMRDVRTLQTEAGEAGRQKALNVYRRPVDVAIEKEIRDRYHAGWFDLGERGWANEREMISLLVFKGADVVRACEERNKS